MEQLTKHRHGAEAGQLTGARRGKAFKCISVMLSLLIIIIMVKLIQCYVSYSLLTSTAWNLLQHLLTLCVLILLVG